MEIRRLGATRLRAPADNPIQPDLSADQNTAALINKLVPYCSWLLSGALRLLYKDMY